MAGITYIASRTRGCLMRVVCVYLNFDMDEHGWAPAPGASPFPTPLYGMKPINKFNIAFQTHASDVGMLRSYVRKLLRMLLTNFIEPKVLQSTDILSISIKIDLSK